MTEDQVVQAIKRAVGDAKQKTWCATFDINETVLSEVLNRSRPPTERLCALVGVERTVERSLIYRKRKA